MASFQDKIGWKTQKKRENKNCHSVPFRSYHTRNLKFQKNSNKIQKVKIHHYGFISSQKQDVISRAREKIVITVPFRSYTTRNRKFPKNSKKIQKVKNTIMASFQRVIENSKKK